MPGPGREAEGHAAGPQRFRFSSARWGPVPRTPPATAPRLAQGPQGHGPEPGPGTGTAPGATSRPPGSQWPQRPRCPHHGHHHRPCPHVQPAAASYLLGIPHPEGDGVEVDEAASQGLKGRGEVCPGFWGYPRRATALLLARAGRAAAAALRVRILQVQFLQTQFLQMQFLQMQVLQVQFLQVQFLVTWTCAPVQGRQARAREGREEREERDGKRVSGDAGEPTCGQTLRPCSCCQVPSLTSVLTIYPSGAERSEPLCCVSSPPGTDSTGSETGQETGTVLRRRAQPLMPITSRHTETETWKRHGRACRATRAVLCSPRRRRLK